MRSFPFLNMLTLGACVRFEILNATRPKTFGDLRSGKASAGLHLLPDDVRQENRLQNDAVGLDALNPERVEKLFREDLGREA